MVIIATGSASWRLSALTPPFRNIAISQLSRWFLWKVRVS